MKIYLVGGAVRDKLLGYPFSERDWVVVGAKPEQLLDQGFTPVGKDFPVFLHPETKEEYALARTERKTGRGYTGFDCFTSPDVTLEEDLLRRDLTINAMAESDEGEIIDPYGGQKDIAAKTLRHVSPAFSEDPLRVLRAARFAARYAHLGFTVAEETLQLMQIVSESGELAALANERIWRELERALKEDTPAQFFGVLQTCGALSRLMPELAEADFSALQRAAQQGSSAEVRFATLFAELDQTAAQRLCQRLKAPNRFQQLALLVSQQLPYCQQAFQSADALLTVLKALDPWRRNERFATFLDCARLLVQEPQVVDQLQRGFSVCQGIEAKQFAEKGLQGKAIAEALHNQRISRLIEHLSLRP